MLTIKWIIHICFVTLLLMLVTVCDARGGRRGGSMGGLFGSWRKYKKPSSGSSGSSRRIVSSSPVHTPITKALNEKKEKFGKTSKSFSNKYNSPPLPTGGSYYTNAGTLPSNAVFIAQAPPRGSEFGDFLTGYLTGRLLSMGMQPYYPHHQQITHVYHENPNQESANNASSTKVIIIDNNNKAMEEINTTAPVSTSTAARFTSDSTLDSTTESEISSTDMSLKSFFFSSTSSVTTPPSTTDSSTTPYGIICMPLMVNEKNINGETVPIERIVCYPAPAPVTPIQSEMKSKPVEIAGDIVEH